MFLDSIMQRCNIYYIMSKYLILLPILSLSFVIAQEEEEDINLDDLWDTTVWEEIEEINEVEGEVEQVVTVAGVRGAEAEDEALHHLYYRKSMRGPNKMELQSALGKLMKTLARLEQKDKNHANVVVVRFGELVGLDHPRHQLELFLTKRLHNLQ